MFALVAIANIVQGAHQECVGYGDMALHLAKSNLRQTAENGWKALTRSDPKNAAILSWAAPSQFTLINRYPDSVEGHINFLGWVNVELREQVSALREKKYPHESIERQLTGGGVKWVEGGVRIARLADLTAGALNQAVVKRVASVLKWPLSIGTVEHVADLFEQEIRALQAAWHEANFAPIGSKAETTDGVLKRINSRLRKTSKRHVDEEAGLGLRDTDPEAKAVQERSHTPLQIFADAMQEAMKDPEYKAAQEVERQRWQELADAIRDNIQWAGDELAARHFARPESTEDWEHLARIVEIPADTIRTGNLTAREIFACALAWADRQKIKKKLTAETNMGNGESADERDDAKPKRRGRKKADYETVQKEAALAADWNRAREGGAYKGDFAKDHGLTVPKLDALLDRVAKRNRRPE
jgi:hypothetical protein